MHFKFPAGSLFVLCFLLHALQVPRGVSFCFMFSTSCTSSSPRGLFLFYVFYFMHFKFPAGSLFVLCFLLHALQVPRGVSFCCSLPLPRSLSLESRRCPRLVTEETEKRRRRREPQPKRFPKNKKTKSCSW